MNKLEYQPGIGGQSVQLDGPTSFVGTAENLRSREWSYELGYRDLTSATRPAREVDVKFYAQFPDADAFRRVADADVIAGTPGTFLAQNEWRQRGYVLASKPDAIHYGNLVTELKVALLDGAWWRLVSKEFLPEEAPVTEYASSTGEIVNVSGAVETPLHSLKIYGKSVQDGTPTPSNPVPIEVIEGHNLFGAPIAGYISGAANSYNQLSGLSGSDGTLFVAKISPNTTFTVSAKLFTGMNRFRISLFDADPRSGAQFATGHFSQLVNTNDPTSDQTYTFSSGAFTWVVLGLSTSTTPLNLDAQAQLEKGSTASPYVPYGYIGLDVDGVLTAIDLDGNFLASLPDGTRDELSIDSTGAVTLTKRVGRLDMSTQTWNWQSSWLDWYTAYAELNCVNPSTDTAANALADGYVAYPATEINYAASTVTNGFALTPSGTKTRIIARNNDSVNTPTGKIYFQLATPSTIALTSITMPTVEDGSYVTVVASTTPTITAEWALTSEFFLDYPHNFSYDFSKIEAAGSIESSVLSPSDVHLVVYGPAVNPYIIVGDNKYQVNVTVPSGGYLTVDGRKKTIVLTLADGTEQNAFSYGVRGGGAGGGTYIFEKIQPGQQEVTYSGSFGFDLGWYEEEGEPPWSLS